MRKSAASARRNRTRARASVTPTNSVVVKKRRRSRTAMNEKKQVADMRRARSSRMKMRELGVQPPDRASHAAPHLRPGHRAGRRRGAGERLDARCSAAHAGKTGNTDAAAKVGELIAERAKAAGITRSRSIVPDSNITVASKRWPMPRAKADWNSRVKLWRIRRKCKKKAGREAGPGQSRCQGREGRTHLRVSPR